MSAAESLGLTAFEAEAVERLSEWRKADIRRVIEAHLEDQRRHLVLVAELEARLGAQQ